MLFLYLKKKSGKIPLYLTPLTQRGIALLYLLLFLYLCHRNTNHTKAVCEHNLSREGQGFEADLYNKGEHQKDRLLSDPLLLPEE